MLTIMSGIICSARLIKYKSRAMYKCAEAYILPNNFNLASYDMHFVEGMDQTLANLAMLE